MSTVMATTPPPMEARVKSSVNISVKRRIADCCYRFVFNKVTWHYEEGCLTLRGCVPSFYLKQVLQELMRGIEQVDQIQNDVDVVSSTGLSSERPK